MRMSSSSRRDVAGRSPGRARFARWALTSFLLWSLFSLCIAGGFARAASRKPRNTGPEAVKAEGQVTRVEATRLTIVEPNGYTLILRAFEDYREKVATGSKVTAWYVPQPDGSSALKSLDYPPENFFVPAEEIRRRIKKVIILPKSDVPDANSLYDAIGFYLTNTPGWFVAPWRLAAEIEQRAEQKSSTLDAFDPKTGKFNLATYVRGHSALVPTIASEARVDAVLDVHVEYAQAHVRRLIAFWDDTEEPISGPGMRTLAKLSFFPDKGSVSASTVEIEMRDAHGKLLWRNRRGFALLVRLEGATNKLRDRPLPEFLADSASVQNWMGAMFEGLSGSTNPIPKRE